MRRRKPPEDFRARHVRKRDQSIGEHHGQKCVVVHRAAQLSGDIEHLGPVVGVAQPRISYVVSGWNRDNVHLPGTALEYGFGSIVSIAAERLLVRISRLDIAIYVRVRENKQLPRLKQWLNQISVLDERAALFEPH